jgi:two-component system NarL family response regulator
MKTSPETALDAITVVIADDHPVVRQGIAAIFRTDVDIKIVAEAANGEEALRVCNEQHPDVLLLDLRMPKKDGLQVITELVHVVPRPRVVVLTTFECEEDVRSALRAGAKGYFLKGTPPEEIRESVRRVAAGESLLLPNIAVKLAESMAHPELSERELQVLLYLAEGRSNKEIGQTLHISTNTAKAHVISILTKLDAMGRTEAIAIAMRRGWIKPTHGCGSRFTVRGS